jgi:hypothetical protein
MSPFVDYFTSSPQPDVARGTSLVDFVCVTRRCDVHCGIWGCLRFAAYRDEQPEGRGVAWRSVSSINSFYRTFNSTAPQHSLTSVFSADTCVKRDLSVRLRLALIANRFRLRRRDDFSMLRFRFRYHVLSCFVCRRYAGSDDETCAGER